MDRAWPDFDDLRRGMREDPDAARAFLRELIDACAGSLAAMSRRMGKHPYRGRHEVWRIIERAGLRSYREAAQRKAEEQHGVGVRRRGFGTAGWLSGYECRVLAGPGAL
jgi:plasmid stabilization system protein ParE